MDEGDAVAAGDDALDSGEWAVFDADAGAGGDLRSEEDFVGIGEVDCQEDVAELGIEFRLEGDVDDAGAVIALVDFLFEHRGDAEKEVAGEERVVEGAGFAPVFPDGADSGKLVIEAFTMAVEGEFFFGPGPGVGHEPLRFKIECWFWQFHGNAAIEQMLNKRFIIPLTIP